MYISASAVCNSYRVSGFSHGLNGNNGIYSEDLAMVPCGHFRRTVYSNNMGRYMFYLGYLGRWKIGKKSCLYDANVDAYFITSDIYPTQGIWKSNHKYQIIVECADVEIIRLVVGSNVAVSLLHPQLYQQGVQDSISLMIDNNNATCLQLSRSDLHYTPITLSFKSDDILEGSVSIVGQGLFCYNAQTSPPNVVSMKTGNVSDTTNTCTLQTSQQDDLFTVCEFMCQCPLGCHHISVTLTIDAIAYTARKLKLCEVNNFIVMSQIDAMETTDQA